MTPTRSLSSAALAVLALAAAASAQGRLSQGEVLMAQGDPIVAVPGAINNGSSSLSNPILDAEGNVLFRGRMTGGGVGPTNDFAYFLGRTAGSLQMVVQSGMADPTTGGQLGAGTTLNTSTGTGIGGSPRLAPHNNILLFGCSMIGGTIINTGTAATGRNDTALLWGPPGSFTVLARRGMSVTTASNSQTYQIDTALNNLSYQGTALNGSGIACFQATVIGGDVSGTTNNVGWLTGVPGSLDWVCRKGDQIAIPGGNNPGTYPVGTMGFNCMMNAYGQILNDERLSNTVGTPSPATTANDNLVMIYTPGLGNQLAMREGDPSPVAGANFGSPTLAQGFGNLGKYGFTCTLSGGVTTADDNANFIGSLSGAQLVHREGTQAPGLPAGVLMGTANSTSSYSDYEGGSLAFYCVLTGTGVTTSNDTSAWLGRPGNLQLLAREGDPAPGFSFVPGLVSATLGDIQAGSIQLNEQGMVIIGGVTVAVTDGAGTTNVSCTYVWDPTTGLHLFTSALDYYPTVAGPTNSFTAGGMQFPSGDGCPLDLNNNGDVVYAAFFNTGGAVARTRIGSLNAKPSAIAQAAGGVQTMQLDAGVANAGNLYAVMGSFAGTLPGIPLGGNLIVPLNFPLYTNSLGFLDAQGQAGAALTLPGPLSGFAGLQISHAFGVIDNAGNITHISRPCSVLLY